MTKVRSLSSFKDFNTMYGNVCSSCPHPPLPCRIVKGGSATVYECEDAGRFAEDCEDC